MSERGQTATEAYLHLDKEKILRLKIVISCFNSEFSSGALACPCTWHRVSAANESFWHQQVHTAATHHAIIMPVLITAFIFKQSRWTAKSNKKIPSDVQVPHHLLWDAEWLRCRVIWATQWIQTELCWCYRRSAFQRWRSRESEIQSRPTTLALSMS